MVRSSALFLAALASSAAFRAGTSAPRWRSCSGPSTRAATDDASFREGEQNNARCLVLDFQAHDAVALFCEGEPLDAMLRRVPDAALARASDRINSRSLVLALAGTLLFLSLDCAHDAARWPPAWPVQLSRADAAAIGFASFDRPAFTLTAAAAAALIAPVHRRGHAAACAAATAAFAAACARIRAAANADIDADDFVTKHTAVVTARTARLRPSALGTLASVGPMALGNAASAPLEEVLFRALLPRVLVRGAGCPCWFAVAVSALGFGFAHREEGWVRVLQLTRSGGGLAIACLGRQGRIHMAVLAHIGWNVLVAARHLPVALRAWRSTDLGGV